MNGKPLKGQAAQAWDAITLAQEQSLVQPLYNSLSASTLKLISDCAQESIRCWGGGVWFGVSPLRGDIRQVNQRWSFGMKENMGYDVTPATMPAPGTVYENGTMFQKLK